MDNFKKRNFYNFCQCEDSSNMSRLCKAIMLLYLNNKEKPEKKRLNMRFSLAVSGSVLFYKFQIPRRFYFFRIQYFEN